MLYLAYGSNLHPARLAARVGSPALVATAIVRGRELRFHKLGRDGSGKCDAVPGAGALHGALYELDDAALARLDRHEGVGAGYERARLLVESEVGRVAAVTYLAQPDHVDPDARPFEWYRALVLAGARHHGFPRAYVEAIAAVPALPDADTARARAELSVLDARDD